MFHDWDWPAAEREFKLASGDLGPITPNMYGFYLAAMGRPGDALATIHDGTALDPLAAPRRNELAMAYNWVRQYDQAIAEAERALELNPNFPIAHAELAVSLVQKGMPEQAIPRLQAAIDAGQRHPRITGMLGYACAVAGQNESAQKVLEQLQGFAQGRFGFALPIARIHAALDEKDHAFEWLQKACHEHDPGVIWLKVDATLDRVHSDPRFDAILQDMRLVEKAAVREQGIQSVAVLPLENVGGDPKTEFLSDGLADQIINSLCRCAVRISRSGRSLRSLATSCRSRTCGPLRVTSTCRPS
jgi:Tfp pilus assembly protein PilF